MRKKLLITIYTYNRPHYVAMNLMSLKLQEYQDFDVMIVDDSSSMVVAEDTLVKNVCNRLKDEGHMIYHLRTKQNAGICAARKEATKNIHQNWDFCFDLNDDHFLEPSCIRLMMDTISHSPSIGTISSSTPMVFWDWVKMTRMIEDWEGKINTIGVEADGTPKLTRGVDYLYLDDKSKVITVPFEVTHNSQFIYRTGIVPVEDLPILSKVGYTEETDFSLRFRKAGFKCYHQPNAVNWHMLCPKGGIRANGSIEIREMCKKDWGVFINNWMEWLKDERNKI